MPLEWLALSPVAGAPNAWQFSLGRIEWTPGRFGSTIRVHLERGSETRRKLVTAAVLRAARYAVLPPVSQ